MLISILFWISSNTDNPLSFAPRLQVPLGIEALQQQINQKKTTELPDSTLFVLFLKITTNR
jgi:hypothetical protein